MATQPDKKKQKTLGEHARDMGKIALAIGALIVGAELLGGGR
jgi:hypothetical protein